MSQIIQKCLSRNAKEYFKNAWSPTESSRLPKFNKLLVVHENLTSCFYVKLRTNQQTVRQFRLAWCHKHSAVTATKLLQPLDLACGNLFRSSCAIQRSPMDCSDDSWKNTFFGKVR